MNRLVNLLNASLAILALSLGVSAQAPVACACNLNIDRPSVTETGFCSASTDAVCTVTWPTPSSPRCEVSGTVEIYYQDVPSGYTLITSQWGLPSTNFTPIVNGHMTFDHPSGTSVACGDIGANQVYSYVLIVAQSGSNYKIVDPIRCWYCELD